VLNQPPLNKAGCYCEPGNEKKVSKKQSELSGLAIIKIAKNTTIQTSNQSNGNVKIIIIK